MKPFNNATMYPTIDFFFFLYYNYKTYSYQPNDGDSEMPLTYANSVEPGEKFAFEGQVCIRINVSGQNMLDDAFGKNAFNDTGSWHPEVRKAYEWSSNNIAAGLACVDVGGYVLAFNTETNRLVLLKHDTGVDPVK